MGNRISTPLRPGDADASQASLARIPLRGPFQNQHISFAEPRSGVWKRLVRAWGRPAFVMTVELARNEQGCWDDFGLDVTSAAALTPVSEPVFGHGNECGGRSLGLKFQAAAADFAVTARESVDLPPGDLVILPVWPGDAKQRLGDAYVDEELGAISWWVMGAGAILLLAGGAAMRGWRGAD